MRGLEESNRHNKRWLDEISYHQSLHRPLPYHPPSGTFYSLIILCSRGFVISNRLWIQSEEGLLPFRTCWTIWIPGFIHKRFAICDHNCFDHHSLFCFLLEMLSLRPLVVRCINTLQMIVSSFLHWVDKVLTSLMNWKWFHSILIENSSDVSVTESDVPEMFSFEGSKDILNDINQTPLSYCQNVLFLAVFDRRVILLFHRFLSHC